MKTIKKLEAKAIKNVKSVKGGDIGRGDRIGGSPSNHATLL